MTQIVLRAAPVSRETARAPDRPPKAPQRRLQRASPPASHPAPTQTLRLAVRPPLRPQAAIRRARPPVPAPTAAAYPSRITSAAKTPLLVLRHAPPQPRTEPPPVPALHTGAVLVGLTGVGGTRISSVPADLTRSGQTNISEFAVIALDAGRYA